MSFIRKPFGYEPVITKEDLKKKNKKKVEKASDWKGVLNRIWKHEIYHGTWEESYYCRRVSGGS